MKFQKNQIKHVSLLTLVLNILSNIMGLIYFIIGPVIIIFGVIFGIILILTWFLNIGLVFLDEYCVEKNNYSGKILNRTGYGFLIIQIIALLLIVAGNFLMNAQWGNLVIYYSLLCSGFFSAFLSGCVLAYMNVKKIENPEVWKHE